jgi:hypothetical protein
MKDFYLALISITLSAILFKLVFIGNTLAAILHAMPK